MKPRSLRLSSPLSEVTRSLKPSRAHIPASIITRDITALIEPTGNIYQSVYIIGKRARQIAEKDKQELSAKLAEFASSIDNLEEIHENREQIEISRHYERQPKPTAVALDEFLEGKIKFRYPDVNPDQNV
jgi:DNA-directed RNA polymerase subunit K/omega